MPQYRKLHVKATESLDLNDMPDDFHRLLWIMLPLGLDRLGVGLDNLAWVKSKVMPLRLDVTLHMIEAALAWYEQRGMIERFEDAGRGYFWIPTWQKYQGKTTKEGETYFPPPPEELLSKYGYAVIQVNTERGQRRDYEETRSGASPEQLPHDSGTSPDTDADAPADADAPEIQQQKQMPPPGAGAPDASAAAASALFALVDRAGITIGGTIQAEKWRDLLEITQDIGLIASAFDEYAAKNNGQPSPAWMRATLERCMASGCKPGEWPGGNGQRGSSKARASPREPDGDDVRAAAQAAIEGRLG